MDDVGGTMDDESINCQLSTVNFNCIGQIL